MPHGGVARSYGSSIFQFFDKLPYCSPQWLFQLTFPLTVQEGSLFLTLSSICYLWYFFFLIMAILSSVRGYLIVVLICLSLSSMSSIFSYASVCLLWRNVHLVLLPIFQLGYFVAVVESCKVFCIFQTLRLISHITGKYFLPVQIVDGSLHCAKAYRFDQAPFVFVISLALGD